MVPRDGDSSPRTRAPGLARPLARPLARTLRAGVLGIVLAGVAVFAAALPFRRPGVQSLWLDVGVYAVVYLGAAGLLLAASAPDRLSRWGWRFLGLAVFTNAVGNVLFSLDVSPAGSPVPAPADLWYLTWYPLAYLGILLLLRRYRSGLDPLLAADGLVAGLGVTALVVLLVLKNALWIPGADRAQFLVNLAYPVGDLVLILLIVAGATIAGRGLTRTIVALGAGLGLMTVSAVVFLAQDGAGTYLEGGWLDIGWLLAVVPMAWAALDRRPGLAPAGDMVWVEPSRTSGPAAGLGGWLLVVPLCGVVVCCAVVAGHQFLGVPDAAVALADLGICVALFRAVVTVRTVSRMKAAELARVQQQMRTDDLTGLPNRRALYHRIDELASGRARTPDAAGPSQALLLFDLDRFKEINDALGHAVGDELLCDVAERIGGALRPGDFLVRLGGDEFAVLVDGTAAEARNLARRMLRALARSFVVAGARLHVDASVGVAAVPEHADTLGELLQFADLAMYEAKRHRRGVMVYAADGRGDGRGRLRSIEDLRGALRGEGPGRNGHLIVHLQPQFALCDVTAGSGPDPGRGAAGVGPVVGAEALIRWEHPVEGLLMPGAFLPLARAVGLLGQLVDVVLDLSLGTCRNWWSEGFAVPVSLNVSATDLLEPALVARICAALERHGLPGRALVVEVTEDSLMADPVRARNVLERLRGKGIGVSIDDYGSGYSSLAYLRDLPADELKLDRTFTQALSNDLSLTSRAAAIVRTTADLAHSLGLRLVAEGIEESVVVGPLAQLGVDVGQGYYLARPMPSDRMLPWLREGARLHSVAGAG